MRGREMLDDPTNLEDLKRYQSEYFCAQNPSDLISLKSAIEYLRGERPPPNPVFYQAQEIIQELREYQGLTINDMTSICNLSPSVLKRLSAGDFRSIAYLHTIRVIRLLEPLSQDNGVDNSSQYTFGGPTSRRERRRKRRLKKSQE